MYLEAFCPKNEVEALFQELPADKKVSGFYTARQIF
jgi:hypothetical protein